jgi:murein DD-endopeptidase MepM/ murein hydrolase activator NlpD
MIEIQFQPADIRKQVSYLFLRPRHVAALALAALAALGIAGLAIGLSPRAVESVAMLVDSRRLVAESARDQEAATSLSSRLEALERRVERNRILGAQLDLVLGVPSQESFSGGGRTFPTSHGASEESLLARAEELDAASYLLLIAAGETERFLTLHTDLTQVMPSICPLPEGTFVLSSPYGQRTSPFTGAPDFHPGIDLAAREGTPVAATGDGRVVFAGRVPVEKDVRWWRLGNVVLISHGARYLTLYAHLRDVVASVGRTVHRGDAVGTVGNTGWSTSAHLHYEVQRVDEAVKAPIPLDPRIFILNHAWQQQEAVLAAHRWAPPPAYEPLPSLANMR